MSGGGGSSSGSPSSSNPTTPLLWGYDASWPPVDQFTAPSQMPNNYGSFYNQSNTTPYGLNTQPGAPGTEQSYYNGLPLPSGLGVPYSYGNGAPLPAPGSLGQLWSTPGTNTFQYGTGGGLIEQWQPNGTNAFGQQLYANAGPLPPQPDPTQVQSYADFMQQYMTSPAEQVAIQQSGGWGNAPDPNSWAMGYYDPMGYMSPGYDPATNSLGGNLQHQLGLAGGWTNSMPASFNAPPTPPDPNAQWTAQNMTSNGMRNTTWGTNDQYNNRWFIGPEGQPWFLPGGDQNAAGVNAGMAAIGQATQQSVLGGGLPTGTKGGGAAPSVENQLLNLSYNPMSGNYYFPTPGYQLTDPGFSYMPGSGQTVAAGTPGATTIPQSTSNVYLANDPSQPGQPVAGPGGSYQTGGQTIDPALLYRARLRAGIMNNGPPTAASSMGPPPTPSLPGTAQAAYGLGGNNEFAGIIP